MRERPFQQVDVFTATPYLGNPVAVVLDGHGLSDATMQQLARWTNLSETTFLLPPTTAEADYSLRIFTPGGELPFAGHPTLGSCHAWLEADGRPKSPDLVVQECAVGLVRIRRDGARLAFAAPKLTRRDPDASLLSQINEALGVSSSQVRAAQVLDNGPIWLSLLLDSPETVLSLRPNHARLKVLQQKIGVAAVYPRAGGSAPADLEVRAFATPVGIDEDPVTGSLNAGLAQWLMAEGELPARYVAAQGACLERAGRVQLERDEHGQVWVGGEAVRCITGSVRL